MLDISCVPIYEMPPDIYVSTVNSLGEFLFIQAQSDLYLQGVNSKQMTITIEPRSYKTMSAMFTGPDPVITYHTGGYKDIKRLDVGYYSINYGGMGLETEAYVYITPGHNDIKLAARMVKMPSPTEVLIQFYRVDDTSDNFDPDFFCIEVKGY
jgi:hypothetical protein